jgi:hypothetical protein
MKDLQIGKGAHRVEIDEALEQILERIDVERIDVVGRKIARHHVEPRLHRRAFERRERQQPLHTARCSGGKLPLLLRAPEIGKPLLRFLTARRAPTRRPASPR